MHCGTSNCRCPIPPIVAPIKTRTACWIMSFRARRTCHRQAQPCSKHSRCKPDHFFLPLLFHSSSFIGVIDLHFQLHSQLQEYNCDNYTTIGLRLQYSQPSLHYASRNTHYCSRIVTVRVRADSRYNSDNTDYSLPYTSHNPITFFGLLQISSSNTDINYSGLFKISVSIPVPTFPHRR